MNKLKFIGATLALFSVLISCQHELREAVCDARHVPERKDDFTWENDLVAYRMYGPACGKTEDVRSGLDVWSKKVSEPIIDLWYERNLRGLDYHTDRGEGADFYKVGPSLGAGSVGFIIDGKLHIPKYWTKSRILERSPERVIFELTFNELKVANVSIVETKRITLRKGSYLNEVESRFEVKGTDELIVAVGLRKSHKDGDDLSWGTQFVAHKEIADKEQVIYSAVTVDEGGYVYKSFPKHHLLVKAQSTSAVVKYKAGAAWAGRGDLKSFEEWQSLL